MIKMRESIIMKIHYGTALGAVALVAVHILMRLSQKFSDGFDLDIRSVIVFGFDGAGAGVIVSACSFGTSTVAMVRAPLQPSI